MAPFDQQEFYVASPRSEPHVSDDEVLRRLIDIRQTLINPEMWAQRGPNAVHHGSIHAHCVLGHLGNYPASKYLAQFLPDAWGHMASDVPYFNDDPSTTHADVLSLFDRAIAARTAELTRLD